MIDGGCLQLPVSDVERSLRFYIERLGVKLIAGTRLDLGSGFELELVAGEAPIAPARLVLRLRSLYDEAVGTYDNRGLALTRHESFAECIDPDGHVLRFVPHG